MNSGAVYSIGAGLQAACAIKHIITLDILLSSRLYCWFRTFTESAITDIAVFPSYKFYLFWFADYTASRESHPSPKNSLYKQIPEWCWYLL